MWAGVGIPGLVGGGGSIHGCRISGRGRGGAWEREKGQSLLKQQLERPGRGATRGKLNFQGAFCMVVVFSVAICSSWSRPDGLEVPPPGSCPGLPSAGSGPTLPPTPRLNKYLLADLHSDGQGQAEPGWNRLPAAECFALYPTKPVRFSFNTQGSALYPHFTEEDKQGLEKLFSSFQIPAPYSCRQHKERSI